MWWQPLPHLKPVHPSGRGDASRGSRANHTGQVVATRRLRCGVRSVSDLVAVVLFLILFFLRFFHRLFPLFERAVLDGADLPIRPAILWNDGRSEFECQELESVPRFREISGNLAMPGVTAPKLLWLR